MEKKIITGKTIALMLVLCVSTLMPLSVPGVLAPPEEVHDVSIEIYSISPWPSARYGELVEIRCNIENEGDFLETITANVCFHPPTTLIEAVSDLPLGAGATHDWVVTWNTEMLTEWDLGETFDIIAWVLPVEGEEDFYDNVYEAVDAITVELFPEFWIEPCESTGVVKNEFLTTEDVYLKGEIWPFELNDHIPEQIERDVYIFTDRTWDVSVYLPDETYEAEATVTIDIYWIGVFLRASIDPQRIWEKPSGGSYDVILDINHDGWYDPGIDLIDDTDVNGAGFLVIPVQKWIVVRGTNDHIYYNVWSGSWSDWADLPGATCDGPATAILGGNLHIVVRGMTGGLYHGHVDIGTGGFSGWSHISGDTPSPPALAASEALSKLYLVVRGISDGIYYNAWDATAGWGSWVSLPGATCDGPAAAVSGGNLHIVVRGMTGGLWHSYIGLPGPYHPFSGWINIPGDTPSPPELTASATSLYLVVRGNNDRIYYNDWTAGAWGDWNAHPAGTTGDGPAAAVLGGELHFVVRGMTGGLWHSHLDLSTNTWSDWARLTGDTPSPPALAA